MMALQPMAELEPMNEDERCNYYAEIGEGLEDGTLTEEDAANLIFGPEPEITYTILV